MAIVSHTVSNFSNNIFYTFRVVSKTRKATDRYLTAEKPEI